MAEPATPIVTLAERKARKTARKKEAAANVKDALRNFLRSNGAGGRFIVFGSAASGAMRYDSDFDVIVDFPPAWEAKAFHAAEDACRDYEITADVRSTRTTSEEFLSIILSRGVEIIE